MDQWYYLEDNQQKGPVVKSDLKRLFTKKQLPPDTLVWTTGLKEWKKASLIDDLMPDRIENIDQTQFFPVNGFESQEEIEDQPLVPQVRPWVRYWARSLDYLLFGFVAAFIIGMIYEPLLDIDDRLFGILLIFTYVFFEAFMLSKWGRTPGKALLRIKLRTATGHKPSYAQALKRNFSVWFNGMGCGMPFISLITLIYSYNQLKSNKITLWDRRGNYVVSHRKVGALRIIITLLIFLFFCYLMVMSESDV